MKTIIAIHNGTFHADDLFAVAALKRVLRGRGVNEADINVIRTRDEGQIEGADYVADVGGVFDPEKNRFDHHQEGGAGERENGIPYAAFGLIWKTFGKEITGSEESAHQIDERLVQTIDALDNGVDIMGGSVVDLPYRYLLQSALNSFQPTWKEEDYSMTDAFFEALKFTESVLEREVVQERDRREAFIKVAEEYESSELGDERILLIHECYPHGKFAEENPQIIFVVKPDEDNGAWKVRAVQASPTSFIPRKPLPASWAGKTGRELIEITGVEDARFVHNKLFIAVAGSKEGALELAQKALEA